MMKINNHSIYIPSFPIPRFLYHVHVYVIFFVSRPVEKHNMKSSISSKYNNNNNNNGNDDDVDVWSRHKLV